MPLDDILRARRYSYLDEPVELRREAALAMVRVARIGIAFYPMAAVLLTTASQQPLLYGALVALVGLASLARVVVQFRFERFHARQPERALRWQQVVTLALAASWAALAAAVLAAEGPGFAGMLAALISVALCSMALTVYAGDLRLLDAFYLLVLGGPVSSLLLHGGTRSVSLGLAGVAFWAYCFLAAERLHRDHWARLKSTLLLARRAEELERGIMDRTAQLEAANARLEREKVELAQADALLRLREEEYRRIFESAHDAVLIFEPRSEVVLSVNQRACEIYGFTRDEFLGLSLRDISCDAPRGQREIERTLQAGTYTNFETVQRRKDGSELRLEVNASVVQYRGHTAILSINRDLTERRRTEELRLAKEAAERSARAKAEFLATVSHEIRTPMNGVLGMTSALLDGDLSPGQREVAEHIRRSGESLLAIINDILDFSRIDSGRLELEQHPFNLRQAVEECLDVVAAGAAAKGLDLAYQIEPGTPEELVGDVTRVRQVLVNLLGNAVKFTARGEVVLRVCARAGDDRAEVRVDVKDTGIGIEPERALRLFEPFSQGDMSMTRRFGGTGLGLAICKRLAERMHGRVWVESRAGEGSTFSFTFRARRADPGAAPDAGTLRGLRLLVVEDHAAGRDEILRRASAWGARARGAAAADEALACLRGETFDALLVDEDLPAGGAAALAAAAARLAPPPRFMRLAHPAARPGAHECRDEGAGCVWRPVHMDQLRAVLERVPGVEAAGPPQNAGETRPAALPRLRILLAEDNVVNQKVALMMLRRLGQQADVVADGVEALAALARRDYDVVLMDVQMPEMDGLEAARRLRADLPASRQPFVVAVTANAMPEDRQRCLDAGADEYLAKPVRLDDLEARLELALVSGRGQCLLDPGRLEQLRAEGHDDPDGQWAFLSAVVGVFADGVPAQLARLRAACSDGDGERVRRQAHAFKGSCVTIGATRMGAILASLESQANGAGLERSCALIDELDSAWERTRPLLEQAAVAP